MNSKQRRSQKRDRSKMFELTKMHLLDEELLRKCVLCERRSIMFYGPTNGGAEQAFEDGWRAFILPRHLLSAARGAPCPTPLPGLVCWECVPAIGAAARLGGFPADPFDPDTMVGYL